MRLKDRVAIVTGGASGIGRATALALAAEGAAVVVADVQREPLKGGEPTDALIVARGGRGVFQRTDVARWADVDKLVSETVARFGRLDVLVNNAAISVMKPLLATTEDDWNQVMAVNLTGVFFGCKRAVQQMLTQEPRAEARGRIVNISSQHGMISAPGDFAYGTGKSGVVYMTRQIAADYAKDGIVCNAVAPGKIITGNSTEDVSPTRLAYATARTPMPRLGRPEDVANAVVFLASDEASYMTGVNLMVDGGWMAA